MVDVLPNIASALSRARNETVRHLTDVGATSPEQAVTYQPQRHLQRRALSYLVGKGVVLLTDEGRHWVDQEAAASWRRSMRAQNALLVGGLAAGIAAFAVSRYRRGRSRADEE